MTTVEQLRKNYSYQPSRPETDWVERALRNPHLCDEVASGWRCEHGEDEDAS